MTTYKMQERHQQQARDKLEPQVAAAIAQAQEQGNTLSLIVLDVDAFRQVNVTYGHDVGDKVLEELPEVVEQQSHLPVVRWGGEEFAVLCPDHSPEAAKALAERIRNAIAAHSFSGAGTITVSLGIATYQSSETATEIIQRAVAATYQAKKGGRNQAIAG